MISNRVAVVTGANKGIGFNIVHLLLQQDKALHVVLTARSADLGEVAVKELQKHHSDGRLHFHQLDITVQHQIDKLADWLKQTFGGLDILVNNAGIAFKGDAFNATVAKETIGTNYFGTLYVSRTLLPLFRDNGRLVNVSSTAGLLSNMKANIRERFKNPSLTIEQLSGLMNEFIDSVAQETYAANGWPRTAYGVSKAGETALTFILARQYQEGTLENVTAKNLRINCCCPGYCKTDMSSNMGNKSALQGATTPVWLALASNATCPQGGFFADERPVLWD